MRTSNYSASKVKQNFEKFFDKVCIKEMAGKAGFMKRKPKKVSAYLFVAGLVMCFCKKKNTYRQWAEEITKLSGKKVSRQGLFKRITESAAVFCQALLEQTIAKKAGACKGSPVFRSFGKVILQDSTTLRLAGCLAGAFAGNHSGGIQKAVARIQSVLEVKTMQFLAFSLSGFTRNDQAASADVLPLCSAGDLVIRDLGYFVLGTFTELVGKGVHVLSRLRFGVNLYELDGTAIKLKSLLKPRKTVDRWVLAGEKKVMMRLVMLPVSEQTAAEKKRRARRDRDKRLHHSQAYYDWLSFAVYVTTVDEDTWQAEDVRNAYRVRWQIEMIFKSWKSSGLQMDQLLHNRCATPHRVKTCIYLMLVFITLFCRKIYAAVASKMTGTSQKAISFLKLFAWFCENISDILAMNRAKFVKTALQNCCYEKRNNRYNMTQTILNCKN